MPYKFKCSEVGFTCPFEAGGKTKEELLPKIRKHGKEVHGLTDAQMDDPKMAKKVKAAIHKTR